MGCKRSPVSGLYSTEVCCTTHRTLGVGDTHSEAARGPRLKPRRELEERGRGAGLASLSDVAKCSSSSGAPDMR